MTRLAPTKRPSAQRSSKTSNTKPANATGWRWPAFSISKRVGSLVVLAVVGQLGILGLYLVGEQRVKTANLRAETLNTMRDLMTDVGEAVGSLREIQLVGVKEMPDEAVIEILDSLDALMQDRLTTIDAYSAAWPGGLLDFQAGPLVAGVTDYTMDLRILVSLTNKIGLSENEGARGKLRAAVHAVEELLTKAESEALAFQLGGIRTLQRDMLSLRRHEKDFLLRSDADKYVPRFEAAMATMIDHLYNANLDADVDRTVRGQLNAYNAEFTALTKTETSRSKHVANLDEGRETLVALLNDNLTLFDNLQAEVALERQQTMDATETLILYGSAFSILTLLLVGTVIAQGITTPLTKINGAMGDISAGKLDTTIPAANRRDEIGSMARALAVFRDNARDAERLRNAEAARLAETAEERRAATRAVADDLERSVAGVIEAVAHTASALRETAQNMKAGTRNVSERATIAASAADQTHRNVGTVAAAAEELSRSIDEIGGRAARSSEVVQGAVLRAREADAGVETLSKAGISIAEVVDLISTIAEQTNLLALNATIEASRAGEAGRGFTVVANEVKTLAGQTARATQDISDRIKAMQDATRVATQAIQAIGTTVGEVDQITHAIAAAVEEQGATTRSISQNMHDAADGTEAVSEQIGAIDTSAQANEASAGDVLTAADTLGRHASDLEARMAATLESLRAA